MLKLKFSMTFGAVCFGATVYASSGFWRLSAPNECSCFYCDGSLFNGAEACSVYAESGCAQAAKGSSNCYTTQMSECKCNTLEENPYVCRIPLTYSFTGDWGGVCEVEKVEKVEKVNENKSLTDSAWKKRDHYDNFRGRYSNDYQRGRDSVLNDVADAVSTYIIVDAVFDVFSAVLEGKDDY